MDRQDRQDSHLNRSSLGTNGTYPADQPARVLPLRAEPLSCVVTHERYPGGEESTSIARLFDPADICRCRRCDVCKATPLGLCLVTVPENIPNSEARLFSLAAWRRARGLA
jgi:hypothetical protein